MNFQQRFVGLLSEADMVPAAPTPQQEVGERDLLDASPADDQNAMAGTIDPGHSPDEYSVPHPASKADEQKHVQIEELKTWIKTIDGFIEFLNAPRDTSIQVRLHTAGCDTLFDDIARSEKKKIARLAAELSGLSESLKGYLISAHA